MPANRPRTKEEKRNRRMKKTLLALMLLTVGAFAIQSARPQLPQVVAEEEAPMRTRQGKTVMYIMDQPNLVLRQEDAHKLDQLNYSFALVKDGKADGSHWTGIRRVQDFLKKNPHVTGMVSVGGWGADGFSDAVATDESRRIFADSILSLMDEHGFTGVDIDWEYPGVSGTGIKSEPADVENWYRLLELLRAGLDEREALHGREYLLSVALGVSEKCMSVLDPARLDGLLDQVVIMAYDLSGHDRITGHHAALYPEEERVASGAWAVRTLAEGGLSHDKMLLGLPAYGRVWRQMTGASGDGLYQRAGTSGNKSIDFDSLLRLEDQGYTRYFDEAAKSAWWFNGDSFVSGDDDRSIAYKCGWVVEQGLQGVAVWQYTQDPSGAMLAMLDAALTLERP